MTKLTRGLLVSETDQRDTEMLGDATNQFGIKDVNKPVKYAGVQCDVCATSDEIVGFIEAIEAATSDGHTVGTVKKTGRMRVEVGAGTLAVNDLVVAGTQAALGTSGKAIVISGIPTLYKWAVVWLDVDGTAGTTVVLERV